jgi:hypothetical protein
MNLILLQIKRMLEISRILWLQLFVFVNPYSKQESLRLIYPAYSFTFNKS